MKLAKDGIRSMVRIGYDGKVYKTYRGPDREERFQNEMAVLKELEARGCDYTPRLLKTEPETFTLVTTNCGSPVEKLSDERVARIFKSLEENFGVVHDDPYLRNITYDSHRGRFCVIDFELAQILGMPVAPSIFSALSWSGVTESGRRKQGNEDSLSVFTSKFGWSEPEPLCHSRAIEGVNIFFAVSDGMGGHSGGALASSLVVSQLNRYLPSMVGDSDAAASPAALLENALQAMHHHVLRVAAGRPEVHDMGATVVCAWYARRDLHFGHVGDSRLYRFRKGKLKQLTADHSYVGMLVSEGKLNERQARNHPRRNILTQAIGSRCPSIRPQVGSVRVEKGDWYLLCSDGLVDGLWDCEIREEFIAAAASQRSPAEVAANLKTKSCEESGLDDTTLFVIAAE